MPDLIWSEAALRDVQRLYRFLAPKSPDAASRAVQKIRQGVNLLARHPGMGRTIEDLPPQFRELVIDFGSSGYLVRYHHGPHAVTLLAVRHQKEAGY
jgi:plasmid stabilization system protein ParE